jgi:hypothetical protein
MIIAILVAIRVRKSRMAVPSAQCSFDWPMNSDGRVDAGTCRQELTWLGLGELGVTTYMGVRGALCSRIPAS